jgi:hypothetical protein
MPRKISKSDREVQLSALALADGYKFVGWVGEYTNASSRAIINCKYHGEWSVTSCSFVRGSRCPKCGDVRGSQKQRYCPVELGQQLQELAAIDGLTFAGWVDGYKNVTSKALINCPEHGDWSVRVNHFFNNGTRCPGCAVGVRADKLRASGDDCKLQLAALATADGLKFIGIAAGYHTAYSTATFECPAHGRWDTTISSFLNSGTRCPTCSPGGYSPALPGTLYALLSDCESMIKIGISNRSSRRFIELERKTPFKFSVHREIHCDDGAVPRMLERLFHHQFPSAGLKGFDGATEWRQMSPDITTWLELLK